MCVACWILETKIFILLCSPLSTAGVWPRRVLPPPGSSRRPRESWTRDQNRHSTLHHQPTGTCKGSSWGWEGKRLSWWAYCHQEWDLFHQLDSSLITSSLSFSRNCTARSSWPQCPHWTGTARWYSWGDTTLPYIVKHCVSIETLESRKQMGSQPDSALHWSISHPAALEHPHSRWGAFRHSPIPKSKIIALLLMAC